jgi:RNA polymerase sigma factor (TIGR02999 family)
MADATQILAEMDSGDPTAPGKLLTLLYDELRKLAAAKLAREKPGQTLQATALVHEAYLRLVDSETARGWNSRGHFFGAAAEAMCRILVENARRKKRQKHGGEWKRVDLQGMEIACVLPDEEVLALNDALQRLEQEDPLKTRLVQLRFFAGLSNEEAAEALGVSAATAKRHWRYARAWLHREIRGGEAPPQSK